MFDMVKTERLWTEYVKWMNEVCRCKNYEELPKKIDTLKNISHVLTGRINEEIANGY